MDGQRKATRSRTSVTGTGRTLWELGASGTVSVARENPDLQAPSLPLAFL